MKNIKRLNPEDILNKKKLRKKITVLTAYDYPFAYLVDQAGIDIVLVGDSLANVVLGLPSTKDVGMNEMIHHAKAAARAVKRAMVVADMPFEAYQKDPSKAVLNAKRFIEEAGCDAVKVEWFSQCLEVAEAIVNAGIPVMGHVGLTPQTADKLGGLKVQGKDSVSAEQIIEQAVALEKCGCFSIVLECIPSEVSKMITSQLKIPTIGIGAGIDCDGQVLVIHDVLGLFDQYKPKFVKRYCNLSMAVLTAIKQFKSEVEKAEFPDDAHSYSIEKNELDKIKSNHLSKEKR